jgi:hypothetical protein
MSAQVEQATFKNWYEALQNACDVLSIPGDQPDTFIRGYVEQDLTRIGDPDSVEEILALFAASFDVVVQRLPGGQWRWLPDGSQVELREKQPFQDLRDDLCCLLDMARSHVEDIESGLEDGTYDRAENLDIDKKSEVVERIDSLLRQGQRIAIPGIREVVREARQSSITEATMGEPGNRTAPALPLVGDEKVAHKEEADNRELREGNLLVSLTRDAHDYNDQFFTLEITEMNGDEGVENDAEVSGLSVGADQTEIDAYLTEAMACAKSRVGIDLNVRKVAWHAARAGMSAVEAMTLGFKSVAQMEEHEAWLKQHGSPEYLAWVATIRGPDESTLVADDGRQIKRSSRGMKP